MIHKHNTGTPNIVPTGYVYIGSIRRHSWTKTTEVNWWSNAPLEDTQLYEDELTEAKAYNDRKSKTMPRWM